VHIVAQGAERPDELPVEKVTERIAVILNIDPNASLAVPVSIGGEQLQGRVPCDSAVSAHHSEGEWVGR
jgi:hypothetical protein